MHLRDQAPPSSLHVGEKTNIIRCLHFHIEPPATHRTLPHRYLQYRKHHVDYAACLSRFSHDLTAQTLPTNRTFTAHLYHHAWIYSSNCNTRACSTASTIAKYCNHTHAAHNHTDHDWTASISQDAYRVSSSTTSRTHITRLSPSLTSHNRCLRMQTVFLTNECTVLAA